MLIVTFSILFRTCQQTPSWQLPRPDADLPRMSSDVGASRIWNRLLDAAFDNSDRRKHGMGFVGRMGTKYRKSYYIEHANIIILTTFVSISYQ